MKKVLSVLAGAVLLFGSTGVALANTPAYYTFNAYDYINGAYTPQLFTPILPDGGDFLFTDPTTGDLTFLGLDTSSPLEINSNKLTIGRFADWRVWDVDFDVPLEDTILKLSAATTTLKASIATLQSQVNLLPTSNALSLSGIRAFMSDQATTSQLVASSTFNGFMSSSSAAVMANLKTVATSGSYTDLTSKPTLGISYEGTTQRVNSFPIFKSATVSSGTAVFNMTADGTSGGTSLCPNGVIQDSVNPSVNDATASYQMSWAWSNSNKTLTVTANKLTTSNILTGILGQAAANAAVVKVSVWCY